MRIRSWTLRLAAPIFVAGLILSGCSSDTDTSNSGSGSVGTTNDINPRPVEELRDGGNLRLTLSSFPATFNRMHVDIDGDASDVVDPTTPTTFQSDAAGNLTIDHNYYTDIQVTSTDPQVITYTINPKAVWSDGTPITWEDLASEAKAMVGEGYSVNAVQGWDRVEKVERGVDDRQAVVTFKQHYAEWQGLFGTLLPKAVTATADAFNNSLRDTAPMSAGPFMVTNIDKAQNRITLGRNPKWWGPTPKLDTIIFSVLDHSAWVPAVQNNEIDTITVSSLDDIKAVKGTPGVLVRRAPSPAFSHVTFNGAPGSILEDVRLRRAIAKAIDRSNIAIALQKGIVDNPTPKNNHIYGQGQNGYQDNAGAVAFDPEQAKKELDELGWKLNGDTREKDGRKLVLRDVMYQQDTWIKVAQVIQQNLAAVGVKVEIQANTGNGLFTDIIDPGNFELAQFSWSGSVLPLGALRQIYYYDPNDPQGNKARIGSPELNAEIDATISELDPAKAMSMANDIDKKIFEEVHSLPLVQSAGNVAVRDNLANWGAFGLASADYTKVGFLK